MKTILFAASVLLVSSFVALPAAASGDAGVSATTLKVKLASEDGKPKVKVARRLKVLSSCSTDCNARVKLILKTPATTLRLSGSRKLSGGDIWTTWIQLNGYGFRYLKKTYRKSVLKVILTATDTVTKKRVVKTRNFRLYR